MLSKGTVFFLATLATNPAIANDLCFKRVSEFSEDICAKFVATDGKSASEKYSGELSANLPKFLEKIANIGGEGGVTVSDNEYTNILREDIPLALKEGRNCRLEVAKSFFDKICPARIDSSAFNNQAIIDDIDGYTNVRSGPGMQYAVFAKQKNGDVFYTHVQNNPWWQVKTSDGKVGYMHSSRIRLVGK